MKNQANTTKSSKRPNHPQTLTAMSELTYVDLGNLERLTKSDSALMMELISVYLEQTPTMLQVIKQGLTDKNADVLKATIHKMIPSLTIIGVDPAYEKLARKIQEYDYSGGFTPEVENMILKLEEVCLGVCMDLRQVFEQLNENENETKNKPKN
jgi:HPt (histidine-containing phosphotransfer) domain-containing protein